MPYRVHTERTPSILDESFDSYPCDDCNHTALRVSAECCSNLPTCLSPYQTELLVGKGHALNILVPQVLGKGAIQRTSR